MHDKFTAIDEPYEGWLLFSGYYLRSHKQFAVDVHHGEPGSPLQVRSLHLLNALRQALKEQYQFSPRLPYAGELSGQAWETLLKFERLVLLSGKFYCQVRASRVRLVLFKHSGEQKFEVEAENFLSAISTAVKKGL